MAARSKVSFQPFNTGQNEPKSDPVRANPGKSDPSNLVKSSQTKSNQIKPNPS